MIYKSCKHLFYQASHLGVFENSENVVTIFTILISSTANRSFGPFHVTFTQRKKTFHRPETVLGAKQSIIEGSDK